MALYVFLWYVLALNRKLWNGNNLSRDRNPTLLTGQNAKQEDNTRTTDNQPHETNWGICRLLAALSTRTSLCFSCPLVQPRMIDTLLKLIHFYYLWAASQCRNPACFKHVMSTMWSRPGCFPSVRLFLRTGAHSRPVRMWSVWRPCCPTLGEPCNPSQK